MAHAHRALKRYSPKSGHPEGKFFARGGGPGRYAKGLSATQRNEVARKAV